MRLDPSQWGKPVTTCARMWASRLCACYSPDFGALLQNRNCLAELLSLWSHALCELPRSACFYHSGAPRSPSSLQTTSAALIVSKNQSNERANNSNPSQTSQQKWSQSETLHLCIMRALLGNYYYWTLLYVIQLNPLVCSMKIGLSS